MKQPFIRQTVIPIYEVYLCLSIGDDMAGSVRAGEFFDGGENGPFKISLLRSHLRHRFIAHEVFHAVARIAHRRGLKYDPDNHEAYAYLCGWISQWIYRMIQKAGEHVL